MLEDFSSVPAVLANVHCKREARQAAVLIGTLMGFGVMKGVLLMKSIACCAGDGPRNAVPGAVIRGDVPRP